MLHFAAFMLWALETFSLFKALGPDEIYPILLQPAGDIIIEPFIRLFRARLTLICAPVAWKYTILVFIPKTGKGEYEFSKDCRSISLTRHHKKVGDS